MSFIRPGQSRKKRAFVRKRPQWDDSVNDLDSYRATPEEVEQRKQAHKSKNHISVKLEKLKKEKQKQRTGLTNVEARQVAIMKEVLHDQQQLDGVLSKTDQMLAMVKDLFGDDAKKFVGHPNVTVPPGSQQSTSLPGAPEIRTRIEKLSESIMSQSALNDLSGSSDEESEEEEEGGQPAAISFQPRLDLQRFQQFLQQEENSNSNAVPTTTATQADIERLHQLQQILLLQEGRGGGGVRDNNNTLSTISGHGVGSGVQFGLGQQQGQGPAHSTHLLEPAAVQTPPNSGRSDSGSQRTPPPQSALNDTGKVKKSRRRVKPHESQHTNPSSLSMTDMKQVLECLQAEIADFERRTGRRSVTDTQESQTFTGYTVSLVTAVTKLTHYMKETELRLQAEMMVREQLAQDVRQLTLTIDSLTQEVIVTQEEHGKLANEYQRFKQQTQGEMALLKAQLLDMKHQQSGQDSHHSTPGKAASAGSEHGDDNYSALPDHVTQPSAAVLLSPLVRKTRVQDDAQSETAKPKRQTSLVDIPSLLDNTQPQQQQSTAAASVSMTTTSLSSSTLISHRDPPRLTQTLPVMATVSVPRPIPLVQSNVPLSLPGSQAAGPLFQSQAAPAVNTSMSFGGASGTIQSGLTGSSASNRDQNRTMDTQIAELNRQHAEAQQRLQSLLVQQKRQHDHLQLFEDEDRGGKSKAQSSGAKPSMVQEGRVPVSVSPPISPISHQSERFTQQDPMQRLTSMSREIKVAMPMVDLEVSAGSLNASL